MIFAGTVDRAAIAGRYRDADIFTLAPREEGFGNAFAEALASGLPVVGSTVGGIPELVEHGKNGFLVPPGEPMAIAAGIRHLADHADLRQDIGRWNRLQAEANLSWARVTTRYLSIYRGVLRRAPRRAPTPTCRRAPGERQRRILDRRDALADAARRRLAPTRSRRWRARGSPDAPRRLPDAVLPPPARRRRGRR